jgi:hypothetical protein
MTSAFKKKLDEIRAIGPELNSAADEANRIVKEVERVLVQETKIGVRATTSCFGVEQRTVDGETHKQELRRRLAFGRVNGVYCIHVDDGFYRYDEATEGMDEEVYSEHTPWSRCDRDTRLAAFEKLPELIDEIVNRAKCVVKTARETAAKVKNLIADDDKDGTEASSTVPLLLEDRVDFAGVAQVLPNSKAAPQITVSSLKQSVASTFAPDSHKPVKRSAGTNKQK